MMQTVDDDLVEASQIHQFAAGPIGKLRTVIGAERQNVGTPGRPEGSSAQESCMGPGDAITAEVSDRGETEHVQTGERRIAQRLTPRQKKACAGTGQQQDKPQAAAQPTGGPDQDADPGQIEAQLRPGLYRQWGPSPSEGHHPQAAERDLAQQQYRKWRFGQPFQAGIDRECRQP